MLSLKILQPLLQFSTFNLDAIMADISLLQASHSHEVFASNYQLFKNKWEAKKKEEIKTFLAYFDKEWVSSTNNGWYEGFTRDVEEEDIPSNDNGLESKNGKIKDVWTQRTTMPLNEYLDNAMFMMRNWSMDAARVGDWHDTVELNKECYELAFDFVRKNGIGQLGNQKKDEWIVCKDQYRTFCF